MSDGTDSDSASQKMPKVNDEAQSAKESKKSRKENKNAKAVADASPHVTGRVLHVEIDSAGATFSVKPKKGKIDTFRLGEVGSLSSATTLLAAAISRKSKVRVDYQETADHDRAVTKLRLQC